jgi:hypothetical protein
MSKFKIGDVITSSKTKQSYLVIDYKEEEGDYGIIHRTYHLRNLFSGQIELCEGKRVEGTHDGVDNHVCNYFKSNMDFSTSCDDEVEEESEVVEFTIFEVAQEHMTMLKNLRWKTCARNNGAFSVPVIDEIMFFTEDPLKDLMGIFGFRNTGVAKKFLDTLPRLLILLSKYEGLRAGDQFIYCEGKWVKIQK